jgi:hypothetical protein
MALTNKAYTTVDDVKTAMSLEISTDDDFIQHLIGQAQKAIDEYLGFAFQTDGTVASPTTKVFDGNGGYQLLIEPIITLSSVTVQTYGFSTDPDTGAITRSYGTATDITGAVFLNPPNLDYGFILERVNAVFPLAKQNIHVAGVWGKYAQVPNDIKRACERLTIHYYKQRDANYQDATAEAQFGMMVFQQAMPRDICEILELRRPRIFRTR